MKKIISVFTLLLLIAVAHAQTSNVIVFTENGERFSVILNGLRQNEKPETNVKITGLNANFYKMKVIFVDATLGEKNFNLGFNEGMETSFVIKKNSKGEYILRPISETPVAEAPVNSPTQTVVMYNPEGVQSSQTVTQTTTTTNETPGGNISMGVNAGDAGAHVNVNVTGFDNSMQTTATSSVTTTTVTQTTTTTTNDFSAPPPPPPPPPPSYLPGYNGPVGCPYPMNPADFSDLKNSIASKSFEDSKMTIAKQVLQNNCLFVSQVKDLMGQFTFEATKLDFAKYAYDFTYDIGNYFKVNDMFTFESSIDDLNSHISSRKR